MAVAPPSGSEAPYTQAAAADAPRGLLEKIEDFCSRPCFTESISDFASQHSSEFACEPNEGEHPVSLSRTPSHRTAPGRRNTPPPLTAHAAATPHTCCRKVIELGQPGGSHCLPGASSTLLPAVWQLRWHELYLQYTALIEGQLEAFLKEEGVPVAAMLSAAASDDTGASHAL